MPDYLLPFCFALLAWWLSTGVILFLNHLRARTYRWSMLAATVLLLGSLVVLHTSSTDTTPVGAMLAFTAALLVWGWLEISYFMGFLTGPRKLACPTGSTGWRRFGLALQTSLHHEAAVVLLGAVLIGLTWDAPNRFGTWTFVTLWLMRWSAKLNLYLGVPHINEHWFPEHLRFLTTYMRRRPMNLFFPVAITSATALMVLLLVPAATTASDDFTRTGDVLVATLLALGILEHWFMVLPLRDSALWNWALRQAGQPAADVQPGPEKSFEANKRAA
jgi:putative photosynthetic complex assembly protein 2